jgi:hemerythrin-like domain-containing protein
MSKPARSPVPPASLQPGLAQWHQLHQLALARMSDLANALDRQGWMEVDRACRWLHEEFRPHNDREERELMPLLAAVVARPLWRQLRADHQEMGHLTQALLHGHAGGRVHDLGRHGQRARRLLNLVRQHIDTEEHVVLPLIQGQCLPSFETGEGYLMLPAPCAANAYPRA